MPFPPSKAPSSRAAFTPATRTEAVVRALVLLVLALPGGLASRNAAAAAADHGGALPHRFGHGQAKALANRFLQHHGGAAGGHAGLQVLPVCMQAQLQALVHVPVDTGLDTMTGGRLLRVKKYVGGERFCLTYGDGVSDVNIAALAKFHEQHRRHATVTALQPAGRFGALEFDGDHVSRFVEKPRGDGRWINGGFFVLEPQIFDYLNGDEDVWEQEPLRRLADDGHLVAYRHSGFWAAMDTLRDKNHLEELWATKQAPWKVWQ